MTNSPVSPHATGWPVAGSTTASCHPSSGSPMRTGPSTELAPLPHPGHQEKSFSIRFTDLAATAICGAVDERRMMHSTAPLAVPRSQPAMWPPFAVYPSRPAPPPRTLLEVLEATASRFPDAAAIDDGRQVLTYSALI